MRVRATSPVDRRVVLKRLGLLLVCGVVGPVAGCGPDDQKQSDRIFPGNPKETGGPDDLVPFLSGDPTISATALAQNQANYYPPLRVIICHDANGYYALSSICPHANCDLAEFGPPATCGVLDAQDLSQGFYCCCHDSVFDSNGDRISGPAPRGLDHLKIVIDDAGTLWIDIAVTVPGAARVLPS